MTNEQVEAWETAIEDRWGGCNIVMDFDGEENEFDTCPCEHCGNTDVGRRFSACEID